MVVEVDGRIHIAEVELELWLECMRILQPEQCRVEAELTICSGTNRAKSSTTAIRHVHRSPLFH